MNEDTAPAGPRYFAKGGEGVHVVFNLEDAAPYAALGYQEVDEATYQATLPDPGTAPAPSTGAP